MCVQIYIYIERERERELACGVVRPVALILRFTTE
jgi:hypothetical protein